MGLFDDLVPSQSAGPPTASPAAPSLDPRSREFAIRTVLGEAANESDDGMAGVAAVIKNRLQAGRYGGNDVVDVVRAKSQFEPWGTADGQRRMFNYSPDSESYKRAGAAVDRVFGEGYDPTNGATHFYSPTAQAALGRQAPAWAQGQEPQNIGLHAFYAPEGRVQSTDVSAQAKRPAGGLFDDLVPATASSPPATSPPDTGSLPDTGGRFTDAPGQSFRTAREGQSPAVAGKGQAFGAHAINGAMFNFADELMGTIAAGGADLNDPSIIKYATSLAAGIYKRATGDPDADAAYRAATSAVREALSRQMDQQPVASVGGEITGALATAPATGGLGVAARGAGLGVRMLAGAKAGAAYGAVSGAGEGTDPASRVTGAATGGLTGAAIGAAGAPVVEGVVRAARLASVPFQPIVQAIRGIRDPEGEAARRVVGAIQRDAQATGGPAGLTPGEFQASVNAGGPAAVADLGGETTRALARSAANTSPEARAALNNRINDRFESQSDRVTGWLNQTFGPSDTGATREALQQAAQRANRPAYARAYGDGDRPLWTPELQRLAGSPDVVEAMRAAAQKGKSRAITDGFGGFNSSVQISPTGVVQFSRGPNGQPTYPNLQFWDYTKRALDDGANAARRAGRNDEASVLGQLATGLRNELDTQVPTYQAARAGAARFFGANDALEAGGQFLTSNAPIADARRAFAAMSQPERELFRQGFVQSLTQKIESTGDRRNVLNSIAQSPRAREQMELAMGPQRAREFEAMMRVEGVMDLARGAVQGNSTTARQLAELGLAGGAYGIGSGGDILNPNPSALASAALVWGAARGKGAIDRRVAQRVGEMLASNDPGLLRRGINIVARNQNFLNALRSFDIGVARAGPQQAPGLPAIQSMGTGRADDQQPSVPRPPGQ